jgi:signal transduction histidine kinase
VQLAEPVDNAMMNVYRPDAHTKRPAGWTQRKQPSASAMRDRETQLVRAEVSDMSAAWIPSLSQKARSELVLYRSAEVKGKKFIQGALLDWPALRGRLVGEVKELFPSSSRIELVPKSPARRDADDLLEEEMSTLPVVLRTDAGASPVSLAWNSFRPIRTTLLITWGLALIALLVTAAAITSMGELAQRRMNFVSAVSHELRTPLTALRMYLDMRAEGMIESEEKRGEVLKTLQGQAERLSGVVRGVLDYSRLERQTLQAHRQTLELQSLFTQVEQACRDRCAASDTSLTVETKLSDDDATVDTDPEAVTQIVLNLVDNACKYAGSNGQVRLSSACEERAIVFRVSDDGPGIPPGAQRKLFDAFYRAGNEMTREHPGVGLGLAISRGFATAIGAELELVGSPMADGNLEATFALRLPRPTPQA